MLGEGVYIGVWLCVCACVHANQSVNLIIIECWGSESVKLYLHSQIHLHGVLTTETTLSRETVNLCTYGTSNSSGTEMDNQPQATAAQCVWYIPSCGGGCQRQTEHAATIPHQWKEWCSVDMYPLWILTPLKCQAHWPLRVYTCVNIIHAGTSKLHLHSYSSKLLLSCSNYKDPISWSYFQVILTAVIIIFYFTFR
jgi:hypothetical protein